MSATIDTLPDDYDAIPYDSTPITETDPDRLAVLGRLFGLESAHPETCRVLELGCASGGNLIPLAWRLPGSQFVGIDLAASQVQAGQQLIDRLGLSNTALQAADILTLDAVSLGKFDYVIAHGIYSWVPAAVRDRILALCRALLTPHGIAYISYNTLPGWRMRGMLRDMLLHHTRHARTPGARLASAYELFDFLDHSLQELNAFNAQYLKQEIARIRNAHPSYLYHEYLAPVNEPLLFNQFMGQAAGHGLQYLCESDLHTAFPETLGDSAAAQLLSLDDPLEQAQYMDFIVNRNFRQTLLCQAAVPIMRNLDMDRLTDLAFYSDLAPPRKVDLRRNKATPFTTASGDILQVHHPLTKAALMHLRVAYPAAVALSELPEKAAQLVGAHGGANFVGQEDHFFSEWFSLFVHQGVGASLQQGPRQDAADRAHPRLHALARAQAELRLGHLATPRHTTLYLDEFATRLASYLNGSRDLTSLTTLMRQHIERGELTPPDKNASSDPAKLGVSVERNVTHWIEHLARQGLLEAG